MATTNNQVRDRIQNKLDAELTKQKASFTQYEPVKLEDVSFDQIPMEGNPYKDYQPEYNSRFNPFSPTTEVMSAISDKLEQPYQITGGGTTNYWEQFKNINVRDALKINLESSLNDLRENEAKWLPEVQEAQRYLQAKNTLLTVDNDDPNRNQTIQEALNVVKELEPKIKDYAISNPYLKDIFYGKANYYGNSGAIVRSITPDEYISTDFYSKGRRWKDIENDMWNAKNDFTNPITQLNQLRDNLSKLQTEYDDKKADIKDKYNGLNTARYLHDPLLGIIPTGIYYDPSKIDPELDKRRSEEEISLFNPSSWQYGLLHLGSSYSEAQMMASQMALAAAIKFGSKLASNVVPFAPLLLAVGENAMNLWFTNYFREKETGSEAMSNYMSRVLQDSEKGNIDLNRILAQYSTQLDQQGYDVSKMDDMTKLELGLAYNLNTDDSNYNRIVKESTKGLDRLKAVNDALSLSDYLENFGLSYSGKYISNYFGNKAKQLGSKMLQGRAADLLNNKITQNIRRKVNKAADVAFENVGNRLKAKHVIDQLKDMGLSMGKRWMAERTEEGIQTLVGAKYQAGMYDDSDYYSFLRGIVDDARLGIEANLAYYGLHPSDTYNTNEELKRSMEIGGFTGVLMGGAASSISNMYDLRNQLRADERISRLAADGYEKAENTFKTRIFLDGIRKGKGSQYLFRSLDDLKRFKPIGVTDEMIDEDKNLVRDVEAVYRNTQIEPNLKKLNIKRNSQDFEDLTVAEIDLSNRLNSANKVYRDGFDNYNKLVSSIVDDESDSVFNQLFKKSYDEYLRGLKEGQEQLDFKQFKDRVVRNLLTKERRRILSNLIKDLKARKTTLERLKADTGLDVNTTDIASILDYVTQVYNEEDKQYKKLGGKKAFRKTGVDIPNLEELNKQFAANVINGAVVDALNHKLEAYVTGRLNLKYRGYYTEKPLFSTLSDEQKAEVISKYTQILKEQKKDGKEPTLKQIIAKYNLDVQQEWNSMESNANVEENERFLANLMFQQDINKVREQRRIAENELDEQYASRTERNAEQEVQNIEEDAASIPPQSDASQPQPESRRPQPSQSQPQEEQPQPRSERIQPDNVDQPEDIPQDASTGNVDDEIDEAIDRTPDKNNDRIIEEFDISEVDNVTSGSDAQPADNVNTQGYDPDELYKTDSVDFKEEPDHSSVSTDDGFIGQQDRVENGDKFDMPDQAEPRVETEQPDNIGKQEQPESPEQVEPQNAEQPAEKEIPEKSDKPGINKQGQKRFTVESQDGTETTDVGIQLGEDEIAIYSNGTDVWMGNEVQELGTEITDQQLEMQETFDNFEATDDAFSKTAKRECQINQSPNLETKQQIETNRIHSTFFYNNASTEVMPINTNGIPVQFDGERRPGKELGQKLAQPGWLSKANVYYIVTDNKYGHGRQSLDNLVIHLIIEVEEDGERLIYNTALRTPDRAIQIMDKWYSQNPNITEARKRQLINDEVNRLRELRRQIIIEYVNRYAPDYFQKGSKTILPTTAQKDVVPTGLRISNGSIDNTYDSEDNAIFRSLLDVSAFGLVPNSEEMSQQIKRGEVEFGYGEGPFSSTQPYQILHFDGTTQTSAQGTGYAGKIYIVPRVENTPSGRVSVPIMLSEKTHRLGASKDFMLSYDNNGRALYENNTRVPLTSAELLFRLLTGTISLGNNQLNQDIIDILANTGSQTVIAGDDRAKGISFLIRKGLHTYTDQEGNEILIYAEKAPEGYRLKYLPIRDVNGKLLFSERQAMRAIKHIAANIHWNTSKEGMSSPIPESIRDAAVQYMNQYGVEYYRVLNNQDLVFTMEDLGLTRDSAGNVVKKDGEAPLLLAWMIKHQILKTDVAPQAFIDPFVYVDGVRTKTNTTQATTEPAPTVKPIVEQKEQQQPESTSSEDTATPKQSNQSNDQKTVIIEPADARALGVKPIKGKIVIRKPDGTILQIPDDSKLAKSLYYDRGFDNKGKWFFSTTRGEGEVNIDQAKQWLQDTLGIDPDDVFATTAVMRMGSTPQVYGVMEVVWDRLAKEFRPRIILSEQAGEGIQYHEGYHYASLLILTEQQRNQVYSDYVKRHPQHKDATKEEVEELLAEEFRSYMLNEMNPSLSYRIIKFFRTLKNLTLRLIGKNLDYQSEFFKAIRKGNFKNYRVEQSTLKEFNNAYQNGLFYYYPGLTKKEAKSIPHITNADQMYTIVESLSTTALQYANLHSKEDISDFSLDPVFNEIQELYDAGEYSDDPSREQMVKDVLNNKQLFMNQIRMNLRSLGIKYDERESTEVENAKNLDTGDQPDNIWDRASYEFSKKENVAFNAKLFFYSMPLEKYEIADDGTKSRVKVKDGIFGLTKTIPFNIAWNKILENLWNVSDWNSLLNKVRRLSQADPFFGTLLDLIDDPDYPLDETTVTQLLTTIQSAKNSMDTISIQNDSVQIDQNNKAWSLMDSDNLRHISKLPQTWSNNFILSGLIVNNKDKSYVSAVKLKPIMNTANEILASMKRIRSGRIPLEQQQRLFDRIKNDFVDMVNQVGITFDIESLNFMLDKIPVTKYYNPNIAGFDAFYKFYVNNDFIKKVFGSINAMARSKSLEMHTSAYKVSADRIFNTRDEQSHIALMAVAYGNINPSPEELSVTGAEGNLVYPITENNYMSDQIRWLQQNENNKLQNLYNSSYARHSLLVTALQGENKPKLKLHTMIAFREKSSGTSRDYFGISPLEDYLMKMFLSHNNRLILPTMSDKKTWYSISGINTIHDAMASVRTGFDSEGNSTIITGVPYRLSDSTLEIFYNYFLDEFNTIVEYYNNKEWVEQDKTRFIANYHGKIGKDGKMQPGGNGGRFRYFNRLNINGQYKSLNDVLSVAEETGDTNLMKDVLADLKRLYIDDKAAMKQILNDTLQDQIKAEIEKAIQLGVITRRSNGMLENKNIPTNMFLDYNDIFKGIQYQDNAQKRNDIIYSMIGNYVLNYIVSIEELEKCFVGDPAFYKWKKTKRKAYTEVYDQSTGGYVVIPVESITTRDVDKIKRLSSVLSTGTNLRTTWGDGDPRNNKLFTTVTMSDNMIGSDYHSQLYEIFRADWIRTVLLMNPPKGKQYTDDELFDLTSEAKIEDTFKQLTEEQQKFVNDQAKKAANPYAYDDAGNSGEVNQADAAVYIRPAFYKRLLQSLGQWNDEIAEAFDILEADPDENGKTFMNDPELYTKALKAAIHPLKMMYFGDHYNNKLSINMPIFDKMALFPMFKCLAKADNKYLYDRMNDESLGIIDMMVFESASKVGSPAKKFRPYKDNKNTQFNTDDLFQQSSAIVNTNGAIQNTGGQLNVQVQNLDQLRLQLNTEPHHTMDRSFGTQAVKICMGNVVDNRTYGSNKGQSVTGSQIKKDVFGCIKALSNLGYKSIVGTDTQGGEFFSNGEVDNRKLSRYLIQQATNEGMSQEVIQALKVGKDGEFKAPIASLSVRNWIESKVVSLLGKRLIDVNTPGGSAIQMSPFGFKANDVWTEENARPFNNGKKLSFDPKKGSMEVMLSIKFFKYVIPKEYQTDFNTMRKWLMDNNIINNPDDNKRKVYKSDKDENLAKLLNQDPKDFGLSERTSKFIEDFEIGTLYDLIQNSTLATGDVKDEILDLIDNLGIQRDVKIPEYTEESVVVKPFGIGYRIPTQGLSSTMSFIVADVLPEQIGDAIVVPDEFTAMTGSDYDIDKQYIATYAYDPETHKRYEFDDTKDYNDQTEGALINKLLDSYTLVISDDKTMSETRASIDTLTKILQKEVLPLISTSTDEEARAFYELMPSFQEARKEEYTGGKAGIAPFALNSTNHCLTQAVHLRMKYSHGNCYGLGQLDEIRGHDGFKILDWLSAMINAHVDVAKDPYIMVLNVNRITYNIANLLLRGGMGRSTFYFLAQPILKELTNRKIANNGVIGVVRETDDQIYEQLQDKYMRQLVKADPALAKSLKIDDSTADLVFDDARLKSALKNYTDKSQTAQDIAQQLLVLRAFKVLSEDAQKLSDLVQRSQIDTKKYGNNLSQLQNFYNSYATFVSQNDDEFSTPNSAENGLTDYFNQTFLGLKLNNIMKLSNSLLKNHVYAATAAYKTIFTGVMSKILGKVGVSDTRKNELFDSCGIYYYKPTSDKNKVKRINDKVEGILRARVANTHTQISVDDNQLNNMLFGEKSMAIRLNEIKSYLRRHRDDPKLVTLVNSDGTIANELLNHLLGIVPRQDSRIRRIVTVNNGLNTDALSENRLISAFYDLLTSEDDTVRNFANDLIKYAFYTSYDSRTPNSFFNLIPLYFKTKLNYTEATKDALRVLNGGKLDEVAAFFNFENVDDYVNSVYASLVRNYWNDDDIVRTFTPLIRMWEDEQGQHSSSSQDVLAYGNVKNSKGTWSRVPTVFVTRNNYDIIRNSQFVKTLENGNQAGCLYQCVGSVIDHTAPSNSNTVGLVYVAIPKLGYSAGSSSVYELYKNGYELSAFSTNDFGSKANESIQDLNKYMKSYVAHQAHRRKVRDEDLEFIEYDGIRRVDANTTKDDSQGDKSFEEVVKDDITKMIDDNSEVPTKQVQDTSQETTLDLADQSDNSSTSVIDPSVELEQQLSDLTETESVSEFSDLLNLDVRNELQSVDEVMLELSEISPVDEFQDFVISKRTKEEAKKRKKYCGKKRNKK